MTRRLIVSVVGDASVPEESEAYLAARELGRLLVDAGFRVMTGGLRGVMEAASRGAHDSEHYRDGDTIGLLPQSDPGDANLWVDIVIPTGMGHARNSLVASGDALVAVGGGAGTLSEIAFAWMFKRPVIALDAPGCSRELGGMALDHRRRPEDRVLVAASPADAIAILKATLA